MADSTLTLSGKFVDLELLSSCHTAGLRRVVSSKKLWQHKQTFIPTPELVPTYIKLSLQGIEKGEELPFAILEKKYRKIVGSIKLQNIHDKHAEIGSTFIQPKHQKTAVNSEAKLILMQYAFESLSFNYIEFIIHKQNSVSQKAIERLGIKQNSSFSHLKAMPQWENDEYLNYLVAAKEWENIKENLQNKLFNH